MRLSDEPQRAQTGAPEKTMKFCRVIPFFLFLCGAGLVGAAPSPRVVSLSPNVTDILLAIGAGEDLVGISDYCRLPEGFPARVPRCGGALNPNLERLLALQPDLLFVLGRMERVQQFAGAHGIRAVSVNVDRFADLQREIRVIGGQVGAEARASHLLAELEVRLARVRAAAAKLPRRRCLVLLDREPGGLKRMLSVGGGSFLSEMLAAAGGENVFADQPRRYFNASQEAVAALQPEVIFDLHPGAHFDEKQREAARRDWRAEPGLPAVRDGRVVVGDEEFLSVPGPRMVEIAEWFQSHLKGFKN